MKIYRIAVNMNQTLVLFLLILFFPYDLISQSDTIFVRISNSHNLAIQEIIEYEQGYVILNHNSSYIEIEDFNSIFLVDFNGNIIRRIDTVQINNILIENIKIMHRV